MFMARYVWTNGDFVDAISGEPMPVPPRDGLCVPFVVSDIPDYRSPVDGRLISGRSQRREDLIRNNAVEWEPSLSPTKGKIRNKKFAAKHGLQVSEEFR